MNEDLKRYFLIVESIRTGQNVPMKDLEFFASYTPDIDETKLQKLVEGGEFASVDDARNALIEAGRTLQTSEKYKAATLDIAERAAAGKLSNKIAQGVNLVLAGTDIGNSIAQIKASDRAARTSRRPARPTVPGRDVLLQQALRSAEEGQFDAARATAPIEAQISDQYLSDIQGAKTASTGQAGAYGAYRQLAANRRNRAAMNLAPIQDEIRRGQQARYDNLLGMRMNETQQMFENQASLYPYDLNQYQNEQDAAAHLGATGRSNLRGSLYNLGNQAAGAIGGVYTQARYNRLRNQATAAGMDPDTVTAAEMRLREYINKPVYQPYYEQSYIG